MALTLEKLQRLERVGLVKYYDDNAGAWLAASRDAYDYVKKGFGGEKVRPDDVNSPLRSIVGIDKALRTFLNKGKLSQKYWIDDFTVLVLDRTWEEITKEA